MIFRYNEHTCSLHEPATTPKKKGLKMIADNIFSLYFQVFLNFQAPGLGTIYANRPLEGAWCLWTAFLLGFLWSFPGLAWHDKGLIVVAGNTLVLLSNVFLLEQDF